MVQIVMNQLKDIGLNRQIMDYYPTKVVGGTSDGSITVTIGTGSWVTLLNHIVPHGQQLKLMFLRVSTTNTNGATFAIQQVNPSALGQTGTVEAFPVMGSVPPFTAGLTAIRDYPMLEAAGAEVLHGSPRDPIHVLEGSINFMVTGPLVGPATTRVGISWWGVQETVEG